MEKFEETSDNTLQCPECGKKVYESSVTCPYCGYPLKPNTANGVEMHDKHTIRDDSNGQSVESKKDYSSLFTANAEPILNKYGKAIKIIGLVLMIILFAFGIWMLVLMIKHDEADFLYSAISLFISGVVVYLICIVVKAFIDVFVNISVTLQNIDSKTKGNS